MKEMMEEMEMERGHETKVTWFVGICTRSWSSVSTSGAFLNEPATRQNGQVTWTSPRSWHSFFQTRLHTAHSR